MDRVARRRDARRRTSQSRLVSSQRAVIKAQEEKKVRIEMEQLRQSEEFQREHEEGMSWIQSAQFSPRARSVAYDSMRKLTMLSSSMGGGEEVVRQRPGTASGRYHTGDQRGGSNGGICARHKRVVERRRCGGGWQVWQRTQRSFHGLGWCCWGGDLEVFRSFYSSAPLATKGVCWET